MLVPISAFRSYDIYRSVRLFFSFICSVKVKINKLYVDFVRYSLLNFPCKVPKVTSLRRLISDFPFLITSSSKASHSFRVATVKITLKIEILWLKFANGISLKSQLRLRVILSPSLLLENRSLRLGVVFTLRSPVTTVKFYMWPRNTFFRRLVMLLCLDLYVNRWLPEYPS